MPRNVSIAFIMPDMELGGVGKSLISLLEALGEQAEYHITLLLFKKCGLLMKNIPPWVDVQEINGGKLDALRQKTADYLVKTGAQCLFNFFKFIYHSFGSSINSLQKKTKHQFDVAIAYQDGAATWFTAKNITASVKIAFVHTDFAQAGYSAAQEGKVYANFDRIYCASVAGKESFIRLLPQLSNQVFVFYNIIDEQQLLRCAMEGPTYPDDFGGIRILTIGRLSREKGLDKAIQVMQYLKSDGYQVRWYAIGKGREEKNLRKMKAVCNVEKDFVFMGQQGNPYRMLLDCDIYVQPSNYEGYCIALAEARVLCRPVVACNFAGASEQIRQGVTGIITEMKPEALYEGVKSLLNDDDLRQQIIKNLNKNEKNIPEDQINELCNFINRESCITPKTRT